MLTTGSMNDTNSSNESKRSGNFAVNFSKRFKSSSCLAKRKLVIFSNSCFYHLFFSVRLYFHSLSFASFGFFNLCFTRFTYITNCIVIGGRSPEALPLEMLDTLFSSISFSFFIGATFFLTALTEERRFLGMILLVPNLKL